MIGKRPEDYLSVPIQPSAMRRMRLALRDCLEKNMKILIAAGANVNKTDLRGIPSLYRIAQYGHPEIVKLFIAAGANVNQTTASTGASPLHIATSMGHTEVVKTLIAAGANVNKSQKYGYTQV